MSDGRLLSSYLMGAYFIAVNRRSGLDSEQCYEIIADALRNNTMFKKTMGTAEAYFDEKKIPGRMEWARQISSVKNENNWAGMKLLKKRCCGFRQTVFVIGI